MIDYILKVYEYGYDIEAIAYDTDLSIDEVLGILRNFKEENSKFGRSYSERLKNIIIGRFKNGISTFAIEKELSIGKGVIKRFLMNQGIKIPKVKTGRKKHEDFKVINHDNFQVCPDCGSRHVNDLSDYWTFDQELGYVKDNFRNNPHSYCMECGAEWYLDGAEVKQVLFYELDYETENQPQL